MNPLRISPFGPIIPRTAERQLPDGYAQRAANLDLLKGEINPIKAPSLVTAALASRVAVYRAEYGALETWRGWTLDVDIVKVPLSVDVESRYVWTGDGPPKWATYTNFGTVANDLTLGIPAPITAPTVAPSGGVGAADTRLYIYTFYSQNGEESTASPASALTTGKIDDTWALSGMDTAPANSGTAKSFFSTDTKIVNATGAAVTITSSTNTSPIVITKVAHGFVTGDVIYISGHLVNTAANNTFANPTWTVTRLTADTYSLGGSVGNGIGVATGNAYRCTPHWLRASDQVTTSLGATQRTVATIPTAYVFTIAGVDVSASTTWARVANWNTSGMTRRIYRSAGTEATYQLVAENLAVATTTYSDTLTDAQILGDEFISSDWIPPPVNLSSIYSLPNGSLVGIAGNQLCYSEPYQAHAWPTAYQFGLEQDGVAVSAFGSTVVVGTKGAPYVADGVDPSSVTLQKIDSVWPCLAKRSMVPVGDGVLYSTLHGIAYVGASGPTIWSKSFFTRDTWNDLDPTSMFAAAAEGRIFFCYRAPGDTITTILLFIPTEPLASLTTLTIDCTELYADPRDGHLYIVDSTGVTQYNSLVGERMTFEWLSKEYELPKPVNYGAARVEFVSEMSEADTAALIAAYAAAIAAQGPKIADGIGALNGGSGVGVLAGPLNGSALNGYTPPLPTAPGALPNVTFTLYSKGAIVFSKTVYSNAMFRMPSGFKSDAYSVGLNGAVRVKNVKLAGTPDELSKI